MSAGLKTEDEYFNNMNYKVNYKSLSTKTFKSSSRTAWYKLSKQITQITMKYLPHQAASDVITIIK